MLLFKSPDGQKITVVVGTTEQTMSIAEWSDLIARPQSRRPKVVEVDDGSHLAHSPGPNHPRPVRR